MKKRVSQAWLWILLLVVSCAAPAPTATPAPTLRSDFRVAVVLNAEGTIRDGTFNEYAYVGASQAGRDFNLEVAYRETVEDKDYPIAISAMIESGYNIIVTVGFQMQEATVTAAVNHPQVYFIGVDQLAPEAPANFVGIQFAEDQAGFLVGALAGMMTKTNVVGVVGGVEIPPVQRFVRGFVNGARYVNPQVTALSVYTTSFADPAQGREQADAMIVQGADVIFGAGGLTGSSAIVHAAAQGKYVIGVDQDEFRTTFASGKDADRILSSAVKRVDTGVYTAIRNIVERTFSGGTLTLTAASCGVAYAPFNAASSAVPDSVKARLEAIWRALAGGTLQTGAANEGDTPPEPLAPGALPPIAENAPRLSDCARS
ncbi:MAG: BMP family ABC transporter substrate-binding protein [Candidatus Thermofonsia Clade 1 bacterium]|jgi:basic membrane lipoprotein Med (substrate-binding protein (PBP1-ABC) superfamily)|uniref:BMP family ABC transporter substrate-binding protein n=1 Tax=Candidatus Thermofonsia Clade 1 bacterium TaxID=2364210 RepID=A0A2M8Q034_9CHLR|nr:MAG: BMP family ABC transporter substrate-binding protein [Candidatus Thermofonsia Clade 1 bacterium]PJF43167.1 MAG: BMP family ABC transporter substrate-binding protein [Candidatus Thermofonsia Clade 1 bacterium]RMF52323.1 MAG: BMP family ABC transporter substrate-binding protein [Chloroflexota bacterium]